jgi:probable phosphoglycerate mutase
VILALTWLQKNNFSEVSFNLDSQLVVMQINGKYKVKSANIKDLFQVAKNLQNSLATKIKFNFVPRIKNVLADSLVNKSLDEN